MISLNVPLSKTALALATKYLAEVSDNLDAIRAECEPVTEVQQVGNVRREIRGPAAQVQAEPAGERYWLSADGLSVFIGEFATFGCTELSEDAYAQHSAPMADDIATAEQSFAPADPEPELVETDAGQASGFSLEQYRAAGWTDQQIVDAGFAERPKPAVIPAPTAPAEPAYPPAVPAPPAAPISSGSADKAGLPWDRRIHSDTKDPADRMAQTGYWKARRGVDDSTRAKVEAELRAVLGAPAAPAVAQAFAPAPAAPESFISAPPAPAAASSEIVTFAEFGKWAAGNIAAQKLTQVAVEDGIKSVGLTLVPQLHQRPDLIPPVVAYLRKHMGEA